MTILEKPFWIELGRRIRFRRHVIELTQQDLAKRAGLHVNVIGRLERGKSDPSLTTLVKLSRALGCPVWELALV